MPTSKEKRRPESLAVVDLMALVLGVALAASIPWDSGWGYTLFSYDARINLFSGVLYVVALGLERSCLALVPVLLVRRARLGCFIGPSAFLVASCGLPSAAWWIDRFLCTPGPPNTNIWPNLKYEIPVRLFALALAALLGITGVAGRRLVGWASSTLLMLGWLSLYVGFDISGNSLQDWLFPDRYSGNPETWDKVPVLVYNCYHSVLLGSLYLLPLGVTIRQLVLRKTTRANWMTWSCAILGVSTLLCGLTWQLMNDFDTTVFVYLRAMWIGKGIGSVIAILSSALLVSWLGPTWDRMFGGDDDRACPSSAPSEA